MTFSNNDEIKYFVKELKQKLVSIGENEFLDELVNWEDTFFTSSSEFLGELKTILEKIEAQNIPSLKGNTKKQIKSCIKAINKAFGI
jgi:hypothetical protein